MANSFKMVLLLEALSGLLLIYRRFTLFQRLRQMHSLLVVISNMQLLPQLKAS